MEIVTMNYNDIYRPLSRTSFSSKMAKAFYASIATMSANGQVDPERMIALWLPDEIETFVLNSIVAKEYDDESMTDKQFIDVMNAIRKYQPPEQYERLQSDQLKWVLPTIGAVQFESQQYAIFRLYRHHCLFSFSNENIDVDKAFREKFNKSYDEYAAIVYTIQMVLSQRKTPMYTQYLKKISIGAPWFINNLRMTRDDYKEELGQFAKSTADFRYCLRPSYSYPFIEYQDVIYLPTPHLLIQSITTAMMNRLTFGNNKLREEIGKNSCENYLFRIIADSGLFDEVVPEYEYAKGQKTLDVLTRKKNTAILFDSKLFSPKTSLRTYDDIAYMNDLARIIKEMKQAYDQTRNKFGKKYDPFSTSVNDVYALVVVYQEGYLDYETMYSQLASALSISKGASEYTWLWQHVGLTDIATIERYMLTKTDILPSIKRRTSISDGWLSGRNGSALTDEVIQYQNKLESHANTFLEKLFSKEG